MVLIGGGELSGMFEAGFDVATELPMMLTLRRNLRSLVGIPLGDHPVYIEGQLCRP